MATALIKKLRITAGQRVLFLNAPVNFVESLEGLPEDVVISHEPEGKADLVHLFVKNLDEFIQLSPAAIEAIAYDGLLWISYPKKRSRVPTDLSRDLFWTLLEDQGLRPVAQISIDDVWSALRFRPTELVGK